MTIEEKEAQILAALGLYERRRGKIMQPAQRVEWARSLCEFRLEAVAGALDFLSDGGPEWVQLREIKIEAQKRQAEILSRPEEGFRAILSAFNATQAAIGYSEIKLVGYENGDREPEGRNRSDRRPLELSGNGGAVPGVRRAHPRLFRG